MSGEAVVCVCGGRQATEATLVSGGTTMQPSPSEKSFPQQLGRSDFNNACTWNYQPPRLVNCYGKPPSLSRIWGFFSTGHPQRGSQVGIFVAHELTPSLLLQWGNFVPNIQESNPGCADDCWAHSPEGCRHAGRLLTSN